MGAARMGFVFVLADRRESARSGVAVTCVVMTAMVVTGVIVGRMFVYRVTHRLSLLVCVLPSEHPVATIGSSLKTGSMT